MSDQGPRRVRYCTGELCPHCAEYCLPDSGVIMTGRKRAEVWAAVKELEACACRATFHLSGVAIGDEARRSRARVRELLGMEAESWAR